MNSKILISLLKTALFVALIAIGGIISFPTPISEIHFSLQILFVLLAPLVLGPVFGTIACAIYVLLGVIGLPIFAGMRAGPVVLIGPTGGYLIGFIISAPFSGLLSKKVQPLIALSVALLIIYIIGVLQFSYVTKITFKAGIIGGVLPFLPFDILKLLIAYFVYLKLPKELK